MQFLRLWQTTISIAVLCFAAQSAAAITISIDYTYDAANFFGVGNPQGPTGGAQAKAALEAAAGFYSTILTDSFSPIQTPAPFYSSQFDGQVTWQWTESFNNPATNAATVVANATIAADQYVIYAGARSLTGATAGIGGPRAFGWGSNPTGGYTQAEINQITATTNTFQNQEEKRGQPSGFAKWGGTITFDNDGSTSWFFNHQGTPSGNLTDFYSIALHELGHAVGLGSSTEWSNLVAGSSFIGLNAENQNNGNAVPLSADKAHWATGTLSVIYGTATPQEAEMDPDLQNGTRKKVTALDAAALQDIGWSVGPAPPAPGLNGDYNANGIVDAGDYAVWRKRLNQSVTLPNDTTPGTVTAADYTVWRSNFGKVAGTGSGALFAGGEVPEPATALLAAMLTVCLYFTRGERRR
jgi:hypothetical protein